MALPRKRKPSAKPIETPVEKPVEKPSEEKTMADEVEVDVIQDFHSDEYGEISANKRYKVSDEVAKRWIEEGKACPVLEQKGQSGAETAALK